MNWDYLIIELKVNSTICNRYALTRSTITQQNESDVKTIISEIYDSMIEENWQTMDISLNMNDNDQYNVVSINRPDFDVSNNTSSAGDIIYSMYTNIK